MKYKLLIILSILLNVTMTGQNKLYFVGHSLVNLDMPFMLKELAIAKKLSTADYRHHINIGTGLKHNWIDTNYNSNPIWNPVTGVDDEYGSNHLSALKNPFQKIVITESVPLMDNPVDSTVRYATLFFQYAKKYNPAIKKYIYATWEHSDAGWATWRSKLTSLKTQWEQIADLTKAKLGTNDSVFIVPANIAMASLYDTLQRHPIGSINHISQLFSDDIHLTKEGNYFIACIMLASVYHVDPRGLGIVKAGPYTSENAINDAVLRAKLQEIAWKTCCQYNRSSLICNTPTAITDHENETRMYWIQNKILQIENLNNSETLQLFNTNGALILQEKIQNTHQVNLQHLSSGMYIIKIGNASQKLVVD